jgi:hypothetical protein
MSVIENERRSAEVRTSAQAARNLGGVNGAFGRYRFAIVCHCQRLSELVGRLSAAERRDGVT